LGWLKNFIRKVDLNPKKGRVFSGARPTGRQHLGNYLGAVKNYIALQEDYNCVYCIVDLHALTTLETTLNLRQNTYDMSLDWLAAGMDPKKAIMFVQSHVPEVSELTILLGMISPLGKLTDLPTFKEKVREQPHNVNYGLVGYPVLMAADIILYKTNIVPVGIDQVPHIEYTREIVRTFHHHYHCNVFIEPESKHTECLKVLGTDGVNKMGKSLNNHIELALTATETEKVVMTMVTDPHRIRRTDPGNPDICNVFSMHKMFSPPDEIQMINSECRQAGIGCVDCKKRFSKNLNESLAGLREKRNQLAERPDDVWDILHDGANRARLIAKQTLAEARAAVGLA
jgi:tryptophanyl-tRNA synthetase